MTQMTQSQVQALSSTDITGLTTVFMAGRTSTELGYFSLLQFQHLSSTQLSTITTTGDLTSDSEDRLKAAITDFKATVAY